MLTLAVLYPLCLFWLVPQLVVATDGWLVGSSATVFNL